MKFPFPICLTATATTLLALTPIANTQQSTKTYVDSIKSVAQVKQQIREAMQNQDKCAVGSCSNSNRTAICEALGALDVQIDGKIVGQMSGAGGNIPISSSDLELMKLIFSQCKPSNYQYWNFDSVLHVLYSPTQQADVEIRKRLELPLKRPRR
ncbi:MAG: hypothetical protein DCF22_24300 [Leptolyngbya sp.]|nr:MAG: hypothetical protein DCF22_24300 [Leptolyngbya sp.]